MSDTDAAAATAAAASREGDGVTTAAATATASASASTGGDGTGILVTGESPSVSGKYIDWDPTQFACHAFCCLSFCCPCLAVKQMADSLALALNNAVIGIAALWGVMLFTAGWEMDIERANYHSHMSDEALEMRNLRMLAAVLYLIGFALQCVLAWWLAKLHQQYEITMNIPESERHQLLQSFCCMLCCRCFFQSAEKTTVDRYVRQGQLVGEPVYGSTS